MATQRQRLEAMMLHAGNGYGVTKPLPVDKTIAPNVAPAARSGLGPVASTATPNPDAEIVSDLERAALVSQIQRGMKITRFQG